MGYSFKRQKIYYNYQDFSRDFKWIKPQSKKICADKGTQFYNRSIKSWLQDNDIEIYSIHNEGKNVVAERLFITLKNQIYKYITSVSKKYISIT